MRHSGRSTILSRRRYFSFASLSLALHMEQAQSRKPALFLSEIVRISLNLQRPLRRGDDVIRNPFPLGIGLGRFQRGTHQLPLPPRIGGTSPTSERISPLCVHGFSTEENQCTH